MTDITISPARPEHAPYIAQAVLMAVGEEIELSLAGGEDRRHLALEAFTELAARTDSQYSYLNTLVATDAEGRVAGVLVSYDGARLLELRRSFFEVAARVLGLHFDDSLEAETDPGEIYLDSLAVFPGYRGKGLAGRLIEAAAERHAGSGKPLGLLVDVPNTGAYRLYTRLGFGKAGERPFAGVMMDHLQRRL